MSDLKYFQWGGMNRVLNPHLIKSGDLKLCKNYNSDIFYAKKRRTGCSVFLDNPDSASVYNLIPFNRADGYKFVSRISGTSVYKYAFSGSTWGSATRSNFGGTNDQKQTIGDTLVGNARLDATTEKLAQGIKVSGSGSQTIPSGWILLTKTGSPGDLTLKIETDSTGNPSGSAVTNGTATIAVGSVSTTKSWVRFDFSTAPTLTAGTQYHLTLTAATVDGTKYYDWSGSTYDIYSSGSAKYSTDSGTSYSALTGELDLGFILNKRTGSRCSSTVLDNKLVLGNGVDQTCYTTDGTNFTNISEAPPLLYLMEWQGRVYGGGCPYTRSRLYYSKSNDPTSWTNDAADVSTGGYLDVDPDHNGAIIGLDVEGQRLIVHKEGASYRIVPDEFGRPAQRLLIGASTTSHWSIGRSEDFNLGWFFNKNGFHQHDGGVPQLVSSPIQDLVEGISGSATNDLVGHFFGFKYYCTMGSSITENERLGDRSFTNPVFVYDVRLQEIYIYTYGHAFNHFNSWQDENGNWNMYGGDTSGVTYKFDGSYSDAGTAIDGEIETYDNNFGSPHIKKQYEFIYLYTNPGCQSNILYNLDEGNWQAIGDVSKGETRHTFGEDAQNKKNIALKVLDNSATTSSIFYGYVIRVVGEEAPPALKARVK